MNASECESLLLTLREQFADEETLDKVDIDYLFEIVDILEGKVDMYETIIREGRHIIHN